MDLVIPEIWNLDLLVLYRPPNAHVVSVLKIPPPSTLQSVAPQQASPTVFAPQASSMSQFDNCFNIS